ncbi:MAG: hypothetical protein HZB44_03485 [Actinobacteria bacterium]|nr:hypothetical protein [Actinomycetota bacterium]
MEREIEDILHFRRDISPFLVHLTRRSSGRSAKQALKNIIINRSLKPKSSDISDARFGICTIGMEQNQKMRLFSSVCFTETPLSEIHCLLSLAHRKVDLAPYGLVFLKEDLAKKGVSPVFYLNNIRNDKDAVVQALCTLVEEESVAAEKLLPLIAVFGTKLTAPGAQKQTDKIDFRWEREWRYPYSEGPLIFEKEDIFMGLCPNKEIDYFEGIFNEGVKPQKRVSFIDPRLNLEWYAKELIEARKRSELKYSVIM